MPAKLTRKNSIGVDAGSSSEKTLKSAGSTAKTVTFNEDIWISGAAGVLRTHGWIAKDGDYLNDPAYNEAVDMFEIECNKMHYDYPSAIVAMQEFDSWLSRTDWRYQPPTYFVQTGFHIQIQMATPSGNLVVGMDYSSIGEDRAKSLRAAFDYLQETVKATFSGKKALPAATTETKERTNLETDTEHFSVLIAKTYNNKVVWSVIPDGGKWTQYGVPLYKDVAKKFGVELPTETGEYEIDWDCEYELKEDEKPRRIIVITDNG